jgi:hypothetical protein
VTASAPEQFSARIRCRDAVVNGYDCYGGLAFSQRAESQADHDSTVTAAWRTQHVVRVVTEWPAMKEDA